MLGLRIVFGTVIGECEGRLDICMRADVRPPILPCVVPGRTRRFVDIWMGDADGGVGVIAPLVGVLDEPRSDQSISKMPEPEPEPLFTRGACCANSGSSTSSPTGDPAELRKRLPNILERGRLGDTLLATVTLEKSSFASYHPAPTPPPTALAEKSFLTEEDNLSCLCMKGPK